MRHATLKRVAALFTCALIACAAITNSVTADTTAVVNDTANMRTSFSQSFYT